MDVAVVTDSTSDLPLDGVAEPIVGSVPLTIGIAEQPPVERGSLDLDEVYIALRTGRAVTTAQPSEAGFLDVWREMVERGARAIVSIHVAGTLSGTVERARHAASDCAVPVEVVDSGQVSGGLALQVGAAARVARAGGDVGDVVAAARAVRRRTTSVLAVEDLAHLRRGGRLTAPVEHGGGGGLRNHPLLAITDDGIAPVGRARTWRRALERLAAMVEAGGAADEEWDVVVGHGAEPARAAALLAVLGARVRVADSTTVVFGPVVGAHVGPGAVGVAAAPAVRTGESTAGR